MKCVYIITVLVAVMCTGLVGQSFMLGAACAQETAESESKEVLTAMTDILDLYEAIALANGIGGVLDAIADARAQLPLMSDEDLAVMGVALPELDLLRANLQHLDEMIQDEVQSLSVAPNSPGLPDANYSGRCGSTRTSTEDLHQAMGTYLFAETVRDIASRVCNEVALGANLSLACLISDAFFVIERELYENLLFCVDDIDSAEIEGAYDRLGHVHTDLASAEAALTARIDTAESNLTALLLANADATEANAQAIERLRVILCDVERLLHTPQGRRESECENCDDQSAFPFDWPELGK